MKRRFLILLLSVSLCALSLWGCSTGLNGPDAAVAEGASGETPGEETPVVNGTSINAMVVLPALGSANISADLAGKFLIGTKASGDVAVDGTVTAVLPDGTELSSGTIVSGAVTDLVISCDAFAGREDKTFFINVRDTNERSAATMCDATDCAAGGTIDCETIDTESTFLTQLVLTEADANATPEDPKAFDDAVKAGTIKRPMEMRDTIKEMCGLSTAAVGSCDATSGCKTMFAAYHAKVATGNGKVPYAEMNNAIQGNATVLADWQSKSSDVADVDMTTAMANLKGVVPAIRVTYSDDTITGRFDQVANRRQVFGAYFGKGNSTDFNSISGGSNGWEIHRNMLMQNADEYLNGTRTTFTGMESAGAMMVTAFAERFTSADIGTVKDAAVKLMDGLDYTNLTGCTEVFAAAEGAGNAVYAAKDSAAMLGQIMHAPTTYGGFISANPTSSMDAINMMFIEHALNSAGFNSMNYSTITPCTTGANCSGGKACICYRCTEATLTAETDLEICSYCTASSQCKSQTCTSNACQVAAGVSPFSGGTAVILKVVGESCTAGSQCYSGVCYSNRCAPCSGVQPPPASLTATPGDTQVELTWPVKAGAMGYRVYVYLNGGLIANASTNGTTYNATELTNGTRYTFKIAAIEYGVEGALSNAVAGTPVANGPSMNFTVSHLAGPLGGIGSANGTGVDASFWGANSFTSVGTDIYVADGGNNTIRKMDTITGAVTTFAGTAGSSGLVNATGAAARFNGPYGITNDGTNLYVAEGGNYAIRKIVISSGAVTTLAGGTWGTTDGTGAAAQFRSLRGITTDNTNLYAADNDAFTIRKIVISTGAVTTFAGTALSSGYTDATGADARFNWPQGITNDGAYLYVTNYYTVRKIDMSTAAVTTIAGTSSSGSTDDTGTAARFNQLQDITTDGTNLYVTDYYNYTIRKIVKDTAVVTTIAGTAGASGSTNGTGADARFRNPTGITNVGGNIYISDGSDTVRKLVIGTSVVTTFAGAAGGSGSTNGIGANAGFNGPRDIATDGTNLYVADFSNSTIRKIVIATGAVTTFAGTTGDSGSTNGVGTAAKFWGPSGITSDGTNLYVAENNNNTIRKIVIATQAVTTLAGAAGVAGSDDSTDGTGATARFKNPNGITNDGTNLYVLDWFNNTIRKVVIATGEVTTFAGTAGSAGFTDGTGAAATFWYPNGITTDGTNLYVTSGNTIRKVVIATAVVTTIAGTSSSGTINGTGTAARFNGPWGITSDGTNLYVAEDNNYTIRKIVAATGEVTTFAGTFGLLGHADGTGSAATFYKPRGILCLGSALFVTEDGNNDVRKLQ